MYAFFVEFFLLICYNTLQWGDIMLIVHDNKHSKEQFVDILNLLLPIMATQENDCRLSGYIAFEINELGIDSLSINSDGLILQYLGPSENTKSLLIRNEDNSFNSIHLLVDGEYRHIFNSASNDDKYTNLENFSCSLFEGLTNKSNEQLMNNYMTSKWRFL